MVRCVQVLPRPIKDRHTPGGVAIGIAEALREAECGISAVCKGVVGSGGGQIRLAQDVRASEPALRLDTVQGARSQQHCCRDRLSEHAIVHLQWHAGQSRHSPAALKRQSLCTYNHSVAACCRSCWRVNNRSGCQRPRQPELTSAGKPHSESHPAVKRAN